MHIYMFIIVLIRKEKPQTVFVLEERWSTITKQRFAFQLKVFKIFSITLCLFRILITQGKYNVVKYFDVLIKCI